MGRRYNHAPIIEAIIEFQVRTPEDLRLDDLANVGFGDGYGEAVSIYNLELEGQFEPSEGPVSASGQQSQVGFAYSRADGSRTVQVGPKRFAFVWRRNYTHWDEFETEAEAAWNRYRDSARPTLLEGIGVRFVNHIQLPPRSVEIKDYVRMSVDVPAYLPQQVSGLFMQVDIPLPEQQAFATVTSALLPSERPGGMILLDIDVKSRVMKEPADRSFDEAVRSTLARLRLAKNLVFEACITDATRGLID